MIRLADPYILAYKRPGAARSSCPRSSPDTRPALPLLLRAQEIEYPALKPRASAVR
jgi:hypothetical protein